jgi:hypothetical protein
MGAEMAGRLRPLRVQPDGRGHLRGWSPSDCICASKNAVTLEAEMIGKASSNAEAQYVAALGRRKVALALQGGGSHGAFTWGVLDRPLDDETIEDYLAGSTCVCHWKGDDRQLRGP